MNVVHLQLEFIINATLKRDVRAERALPIPYDILLVYEGIQSPFDSFDFLKVPQVHF